MRTSPSLGILFGLAVLVSGCAENPVTGRSDFVLMGEDQELAIGRQSHAEILEQYGAYEDPALQQYVQGVGERLAVNSHRADLVYRFTVLDSEVVNAFALPGGYIYISRGLLALLNSEAELAAVLGHEIGHVTARHSVRQYTAQQAAGIGYTIGAILLPELRGAGAQNVASLLSGAIIRGYGRDHELEADGLGAEYLARSGYDPNAMLEVIGVLKDQEVFEVARAKREGREPNVYHGVFSTHPDNDTRLQEVVGKARALAGRGEGRVNHEGYLRMIDGMTYGPSAKEGVLRDNRFYHADLGITIQFPARWRVENRPDRLLAAPPANDALAQVLLTDLNKRISPRDFMVQRLKLEPLAGQALSAGDLPAYTALAWTNTPYGRRLARFTVVYFRDKAYIFAGARKDQDDERKYRTEFLNMALGLRALKPEEYELARGRQLRLRQATAGTTYAALAAESRLSAYAEDQLRLLNGDYPSGEPSPGRLLKVVD
ncbi:MAG: M48 family metalloprotease [Gammaproteobacteria bacterium]|nr:M48 family metalloprotease [Gammaproteobacteria bacterium]